MMSTLERLLLLSGDRAFLAGGDSVVERRLALYRHCAREVVVVVMARGPCPSAAERDAGGTQRVAACARTPLGLAWHWWRTRRLLPPPSLVSAQDPLVRGWVARSWARWWRVPWEVQAHADYASSHYHWPPLMRTCASMVFRGAARIRAVSVRVAQGLTATWGIPPDRITVLPVWIDIAMLERRATKALPLHARYRSPFVVVWVGRIAPEKDLATAIRAVRRLHARYPHAHLVVVGEGPARRHAEPYAHSLLGRRVSFVGWQRDVMPWIAGADALLVSSRHEGFCRVLVEAAIARCPIVSTDVGVVGELFRPDCEALVAPVGDAEELATHLYTLIATPRTRHLLKEAARARVYAALVPQLDPQRYRATLCAHLAAATGT